MRVLINRVSRFSFVPEGETNKLEGTKLQLLDLDGRNDREDSMGPDSITMDADLGVFAQIKPEQVPGYFDLSIRFKSKQDKRSKTMLTPHCTAVLYLGSAIAPLKERVGA